MRPHVLFVAAEAAPLAKTGGLGDVITALTNALQEDGMDVSILLPGYESALEQAVRLRPVGRLADMPGGTAGLWRGYMPDSDVMVTLLRNDALYIRRGNPYQDEHGEPFTDNGVRFAALNHAAARIACGQTELETPDIVHAHDWHAGLTPLLMRAGGSQARSVFTIHNLAFHGNFPLEMAGEFGLPEWLHKDPCIEFWNQLSFMKAALSCADSLTTVSRNYAREILTPRFGHGFDGLLRDRAADITAVPNGIDTSLWNPENDSLIAKNFSEEDLRGKQTCKRELQKTFGLPFDPFAPVMAFGSRLTTQKMADVAIDAIPEMLAKHPRLQLAVLGCGERAFENGFRALAEQYPDRVAVHVGYDETRAHCLHAGADMLMHGSRFEPFGLTPIYSMRYGTLPIASRVGGLSDMIIDAGAGEVPVDGANGFLFDGETAADMNGAVDSALALIARPELWRAMQRTGMTADVGWETSSQLYIELYRSLMEPPPVDFAPRAPRRRDQGRAVSAMRA